MRAVAAFVGVSAATLYAKIYADRGATVRLRRTQELYLVLHASDLLRAAPEWFPGIGAQDWVKLLGEGCIYADAIERLGGNDSAL